MTIRTVLVTSALLLLVAGCADDPAPVADDPAASEPTSGSATSGTPSPTESSSPDDAGSPSADEETTPASSDVTAAVYYVGDTGAAGPRVYREFRRGSGDALPLAVELLAEQPLDPDYRTAWEPGQILAATYDGEIVSVEVDPAVRSRPGGMSKAEARAAVEQVIYTVQAAVQERAPVQFRTSDNPIDQVFGVPTSEPLANGPMLQVLSHVSLTRPEQGERVSGDELQVSGVGNSFEANLLWELRRGDTVVKNGFATLDGWMGERLFPFATTVDLAGLAPGDYTFWISTDDPTGGTEGIGAMTDTKSFTIR